MSTHDLVQQLRTRSRQLAPPCSEQQVSAAEGQLAEPLPPLLRKLYQEVGNGGFGPGCRPLCTSTSGADEPDGYESVVQVARINRSAPSDDEDYWPGGLLDICEWGCGISTAVDLWSEDLRVVRFDPGYKGTALKTMEELGAALAFPAGERGVSSEIQSAFTIEAPSLVAWLESWVAGDPLTYPSWHPRHPRRVAFQNA